MVVVENQLENRGPVVVLDVDHALHRADELELAGVALVEGELGFQQLLYVEVRVQDAGFVLLGARGFVESLELLALLRRDKQDGQGDPQGVDVELVGVDEVGVFARVLLEVDLQGLVERCALDHIVHVEPLLLLVDVLELLRAAEVAEEVVLVQLHEEDVGQLDVEVADLVPVQD